MPTSRRGLPSRQRSEVRTLAVRSHRFIVGTPFVARSSHVDVLGSTTSPKSAIPGPDPATLPEDLPNSFATPPIEPLIETPEPTHETSRYHPGLDLHRLCRWRCRNHNHAGSATE